MASGSVTITYDDAAGSSPKEVVIHVQDFCDGTKLPGASVTVSLDGVVVASGVSDAEGNFNCGVLQPGQYTLALSALNYLDSDKDLLKNDGFTV